MRNNKGFGRNEIITVMALLLILFAGGGYMILNGASGQKMDTFRKNAMNFSVNVATNEASFRNSKVVYLEEVIDEKYGSKIKNALGSGYCDSTQSRVNTVDGETYATLLCGDYLIDNAQFKGDDDVPVYKVSKWSEKKIEGDNVEERVLYNCVDDGKELFDTYYEDYYLVYKIYKQYNEDFRYVNNIKNICKVEEKTFYRTKELVKEK